MTQKTIETVFLEGVCIWCLGDGVIVRGRYDEEELVDCVCRVEEKAEKEAEGLTESVIG